MRFLDKLCMMLQGKQVKRKDFGMFELFIDDILIMLLSKVTNNSYILLIKATFNHVNEGLIKMLTKIIHLVSMR